MRRFTDTCKWDDLWFRALTGIEKLVFFYVIDRCNNAGFWERDDESLAFHTRLSPAHIEGAWKGLNRGLLEASGWVWVRRFLRHQKNENLSIDNPAHKQIISLISDQVERFSDVSEFSEFLAPYKGLLSPIGIGTGTGQGKGTGKGSAEGKPESREAAHEYGAEIGMSAEAVDSWFDHFESNGWRVSGKAAMKDWRAGLRNGKRRAASFAGKNAASVETAPEKHRKNAGLLLEVLNEVTGGEFRPVLENLAPIVARLSEPGVEAQEIEAMIRRQAQVWTGDMAANLNPATLFKEGKFSGYYDARNIPVKLQTQKTCL
jgi:uncharacterized phage protein (TIGR02220 family)